jgi:hypothetical protein
MAAIDFSLYLKFFVGLFAIINPLGLLPVFVSLTGHMSPEEREDQHHRPHCRDDHPDGLHVHGAADPRQFRHLAGVVSHCRWLAHHPDRLVDAAGQAGEVKHNKQEKGELAARESIAVVPLALPLMAAGSISSSIVYASQKTLPQLGMFLVVVAFACCLAHLPCRPCCSS